MEGLLMAKNEIKLPTKSKNELEDENLIIDNIIQKKFFDYLKFYEYDESKLKELFERKILPNEQIEFNETLRLAKIKLDLSFTEIILFLEDYYLKAKKLLTVLDEESILMLKKELSKKYGIIIENNNLGQILQ